MELTREQFNAMMPNGQKAGRLDAHWPFINPTLKEANIDTPQRIAAFFAQLAHESGEYMYMEEIASGAAYEGRTDLGNTSPGDGIKYKGHGPIQITGKTNHDHCGQALGLDLINQPTLITTPQWGTASATWFWNSRSLNFPADVGDFHYITYRINGGYNGYEDRCRYWENNKKVLGIVQVQTSMPPTVRKGMNDPGTDGPIHELQRRLNKIGGLPFPLDVNGRFEVGVEEHVIDFQNTSGLVSDGIVGNATWSALYEA